MNQQEENENTEEEHALGDSVARLIVTFLLTGFGMFYARDVYNSGCQDGRRVTALALEYFCYGFGKWATFIVVIVVCFFILRWAISDLVDEYDKSKNQNDG